MSSTKKNLSFEHLSFGVVWLSELVGVQAALSIPIPFLLFSVPVIVQTFLLFLCSNFTNHTA